MEKQILVLAGGGTAHVSGGVGTMMLYLMEEWRRRGETVDVRVIDTRGAGGIVSAVLHFGRACASLAWRGATGRIALVHAHMTTRGSVVRKGLLCCGAWLLGLPVIVHMHGADFLDFHEALPKPQQALIAMALRRARHVVVLGETWRLRLTQTMGLDARRVSVLLNGVAGPAPWTCRKRPAGDPPCILFLGRIGARKGVPELLQALALPEMQARAWTAVIAGDGEVGRLGAMALALDLGDRVGMPGWVDRARTEALLRDADILVLPSHHEALPIAVIEAMAHGVAVIATPVGAVPEILADGHSALLVPAGDVAALAAALERLLDDPALRERLGRAGQAVFQDRLDVRATAPRMLQLYRAVCEPAAYPLEEAARYGLS